MQGDEDKVPKTLIQPLGLLVNELVTNAAKHGAGEIAVSYHSGNGEHVLAVSDEGQGLPFDFDPAAFDSSLVVAKLKAARDRKIKATGKCGGHPSFAERIAGDALKSRAPDTGLAAAVALAKRLRRASPKTGDRLSLRQISAKLAEAGHFNRRGQPTTPRAFRACSTPEGSLYWLRY